MWFGIFVFFALGSFAAVAVTLALAVSNSPATVPLAVAGFAATAGAFAGVPWLASRFKGLGSLREDFGFQFKFVDVPFGVALAVACLAVSTGASLVWQLVAGTPPPAGSLLPDGFSPLVFVVTLLVVGVGVPVTEELFFRGLALRAFCKRSRGTVAPVVLSSLVFGALHVQGWSVFGALVVPLLISTLGALFALAALRTGRLGAAIVGHGVYNTAVFAFATLAP